MEFEMGELAEAIRRLPVEMQLRLENELLKGRLARAEKEIERLDAVIVNSEQFE